MLREILIVFALLIVVQSQGGFQRWSNYTLSRDRYGLMRVPMYKKGDSLGNGDSYIDINCSALSIISFLFQSFDKFA